MGSLVGGQTIGIGTSTETLATDIGLTAEEIAWRQEFISFTEEDAARLGELNELFVSNKAAFVETFFNPIVEHERTAAIVDRSPRDAEAIRQIIVGYYQTLTGGRYDRAYYKHRTRIGRLHDRLDMPLHYFGGMSANIQTEFVDRILDAAVSELTTGGDSVEPAAIDSQIEDAKADITAVLRGQNLDMQIINDTYLHSYAAKLTAEIDASRAVREDIGSAIEDVHRQAKTIAADMDDITTASDSQSDSIDQLAGEISNLSASIEEIAATSEEVSSSAAQTEKTAHRGRDAAESAVSRMQSVAETSETVGEQMDELVDTIGEIESIVDTIDQIADQTNLLALNASIEAARAGEAGAGFAVVADEVKSLATDSKTQSKQVEELIQGVTEQIDSTAQSIDDAQGLIADGTEQVEETQQALTTVVDAAEETAQNIEQVAAATDEQADSSAKLAQTVDMVADETDRVTTTVGSVRAAVSTQTSQLDDVTRALTELESHVKDTDRATADRSTETVAEDRSLTARHAPAQTHTADSLPESLRSQLPEGIPSFVIDDMDRETAEQIINGEAEMPDFGGPS